MSADFAIIGAGNGGQTLAAYLGLRGFTTVLYDIDKGKIEALSSDKRIKVSGVISGETNLFHATADLSEALGEADIVFVVVQAHVQEEVARAMAPYLKRGHVIILSPGATGGALEVYNTLRSSGYSEEIIVAETQDLIFTCRSARPCEVSITGIKKDIGIATLPGSKINFVANRLQAASLHFKPELNVLYTSLGNLGPVAHTGPTLLNAARIDSGCDFEFFKQGLTPSVARVVEAVDRERIAIGSAFGIHLFSAADWLGCTYDARGEDLSEAYNQVEAYRGLKAPATWKTRYIYEDVPAGLIPLALLGEVAGVKTPAIKSVIELLTIITGENFWEKGRTLKKLGLEGKTVAETIEFVS